MRQRDLLHKAVARNGYRTMLGVKTLLDMLVPRRHGIHVNYGGARAGDVGGPLVKVKRLREYFPEQVWGYTLVYVLSNAPYLPPSALHLLKRRAIPLVHNQNGVFYPGWYEGDWQAQNARMALSYHMANHVFWQSEFCRRSADRFLGERDGPGEVLYNAVDTSRFKPVQAVSSERPFTFLLTGKLGRHLGYRVEGSVEALARVRDQGLEARLVVAGWVDEALQASAGELARGLQVADNVVFTGPYTQEQAPEIYRGADAYVMTKHNDPCPNTVLEALASGLPVVYSASGGVPELVGEYAGVGVACEEDFVRPRALEPAMLAGAMLRVAAERTAMAAEARRRAVERFDIGLWIERHREVFTRLGNAIG
jgi:glycosyltransferase involved in cell wall biosynthesis